MRPCRFSIMDSAQLTEFLPDINSLFDHYDKMYFQGELIKLTTLEWSEKMTRCAGICYYKNGIITIRLSRLLLQFRPFSDIINTLLHEMIHAYLFSSTKNFHLSVLNRSGHGPEFQNMAKLINDHSGSNITIFHSFHDEVQYYQIYQWKCDGPCQFRPPYFGWVRRSINRQPQPADWWWKGHLSSCNGKFHRIESDQNNFKARNTIKIDKKQEPIKKTFQCTICSNFETSNLTKLNEHIDDKHLFLQSKVIDLTLY